MIIFLRVYMDIIGRYFKLILSLIFYTFNYLTGSITVLFLPEAQKTLCSEGIARIPYQFQPVTATSQLSSGTFNLRICSTIMCLWSRTAH
jgi:hypothetical protein